MADGLQLALNHALNDLRTARARAALLNPHGIDSKRPAAWCEYGFPSEISFEMLYSLYKRGGLAHGAVNKIISACWKTSPWAIEGEDKDNAEAETTWEKKFKQITARGRLWRSIAEADRRRLVGRYAGLLIRLRDSGKWSDPATRKGAALVELIPAWAGSLKPIEFDKNQNSESYGQPTKWQYVELPVGDASGRPVARQLEIHPDRVFILGDWTSEAIGFLEPAFNAFVSLEKVEGGSGESFLKNAARHLSVSFEREVDLAAIASTYGVSLPELQAKFNDAARDVNRGNDVMLVTQGATVTPLVSDIPDPRPAYDINVQTVAAALDIPTKILVGMQTGERASTEDQKYFNARCQSRRGELSFEIEDLVSHLSRIKVIDPVPVVTVMWDDLTEATQSERLANAKVMTEINEKAIATGEPAFTAEEVREAAGFEPLDEPIPMPEVDDDGGSANSAA